ncbi:MAG: glycosyl hydrolase family 88 [Faecalibacterium sp.]
MLQLDCETREWAAELETKLIQKYRAVRPRSAEKIPARAVDGVHDNKADGAAYAPDDGLCWWTNGFWAGILWQLYHATGEAEFAGTARFTERKLDECFLSYSGLHHDVGFMWLPSAVADFRLTGDADARRRGLHAANLLAGRFNPAGYIRAWNDIPGSSDDTRGWAIIDCMFNIPLLYWASEETGDPRFRRIAMTHADTVMKNFVRADGSVRHIVEFDPETGAFVQDYGGQGYAQGSSWTRGQTWGLYGFVMSYKHTGEVRYLAMAQKIAEYFLSQIPEDGRIPIDFCQPAEPKLYDDIAAAVAACGLIELAQLLPARAEEYLAPALRMLRVLAETADWSSETDGLLQNCSAAYHNALHNVNFTYGDYYFLEAVLKLTGKEVYLW